jgi:uncharacterized protein YcbK (DUF882 family)
MKTLQDSDLSGCVPACTVDQLAPVLRDRLAVLRDACASFGIPFRVNCAFRSVDWDLSKGRSGSSSHCRGYAVDLATPNHFVRLRLLCLLLELGFVRIGIAKSFIHADLDPDKPASVWLYDRENLNVTF